MIGRRRDGSGYPAPDVTMLASELLVRGIDRLQAIRADLEAWLLDREYPSVADMQGSLSQRHVIFPSAFERAHYVRAVSGSL